MANDTVKWRQIKFLVYPVFVVLGVYIILYLYCGEIFTHSPYNSYTKQCIAWLNGRLDLGQNYSWLELAIYNGKYYVSFPPFPSYVLLPFAYFLGENTPESLINLLVALIGVAYSSLTVLEYKWNEWYAVLLPIFLYVGGGRTPTSSLYRRVVRGTEYVFYTYPNEYLLCKERTKGAFTVSFMLRVRLQAIPSGIYAIDHLYLHSPLSIHGNQAKDLLAEKNGGLHSYSAISCILPPSELFTVRESPGVWT